MRKIPLHSLLLVLALLVGVFGLPLACAFCPVDDAEFSKLAEQATCETLAERSSSLVRPRATQPEERLYPEPAPLPAALSASAGHRDCQLAPLRC